MSYGERTVIEGMLAMVKPRLAIEIGRAEGGSLRRIAAHSDEVVSFDMVDAPSELAALPNVNMMTGDSHIQLPEELQRLADAGESVDFVLVDGDHTTAGARRDVEDLLNSPALGSTIILAHDSLNEEVRQGLEEVDYDAHDKVAWVDLDFVPGYVARLPSRIGECWGGLALIVVDATGAFQSGGARYGTDLFAQSKLIWPAARWIRDHAESAEPLADIDLVSSRALSQAHDEVSAMKADLTCHQQWLDGIQSSASWRITTPLRKLKRRVGAGWSRST
jgi:hypothetical protein